MGSYLDVRSRGGHWQVRIEDLDTPRVIPGCADQQLRTLERFGFEWEGPVLYQSRRREAYREAIRLLTQRGLTFPCSCTRKDLAGTTEEDTQGYAGTCRNGATRPGPTSLRFRVSDQPVIFADEFQGHQSFASPGDVVIERRDGITSYQLAVVVDDAFQNITRVVRGADLLASTPWQIELQQALDLPRPSYGHLPLLTEAGGAKLSKSARALAVDPGLAALTLTATLTHLSQSPPPELARATTKDVWKWALANWRPQNLAGRFSVALSPASDSPADFAH